MLFSRILREYKENYKVAIGFAFLAILMPLFTLLGNVSFSGGTVYWEYSSELSILNIAIGLIFFTIFTWFYAMLVSAIILSVRRNLSKIKVEYYLEDMIKKFTLRIFWFYFLSGIIYTLIATIVITTTTEISTMTYLVNALFLITSMFLIFVPQAIVIEEQGLRHALLENFEFIFKKPNQFLLIIFTGTIILFVVGLIEYAFDMLAIEFFTGRYISLLLVLIFVLPFIEILKTYVFMLKYGLVAGVESLEKHVKKKAPGLKNI